MNNQLKEIRARQKYYRDDLDAITVEYTVAEIDYLLSLLDAQAISQKCVKCGHSKVGLSGYCIQRLPDAYGDLKGSSLCGHKCEFPQPVSPEAAAMEAAREIVQWIDRATPHTKDRPLEKDELVIPELAFIISRHFPNSTATEDNEECAIGCGCPDDPLGESSHRRCTRGRTNEGAAVGSRLGSQ